MREQTGGAIASYAKLHLLQEFQACCLVPAPTIVRKSDCPDLDGPRREIFFAVFHQYLANTETEQSVKKKVTFAPHACSHPP